MDNDNVKTIVVPDSYIDIVNDWNYKTYLGIGAYGSGKSHNIGALKVILKCFEEKRKVLVVRDTYESIKESCFELIKNILESIDMLEENQRNTQSDKVIYRENGMQFKFPNGSRIIFKGLDKVDRAKSIHGVSIVWIEECTEIKLTAYKELLGRVRAVNQSVHFILTCNPVNMESWVYTMFFVKHDNKGTPVTILDPETLYNKKTVIRKNMYYHHSTCEDNPYISEDYIKTLEETKEYDEHFYTVARLGRFGASGDIVLPQFRIAKNAREFKNIINSIPKRYHFTGFDFGFEESYNAVVKMAVDDENKILYIYDEIYENHVTDDVFVMRDKMQSIKQEQQELQRQMVEFNPIVADSASPKDIQFYSQSGFYIRKCKNRGVMKGKKGSRIENTKKIKRFKRIICSPACINTIRELQTLTYKKDRNDKVLYDQFNIDPHTFSAIWYALDNYTVSDLKYSHVTNSYAA